MRSLLPLLPLLGGCTLLGMPNLEGTWLFMVDRNTTVTGDCADPDDPSTTTYSGTSDSMVEIFKTADGAYAVAYGVFLTGDWNDDKVFEASYTDREEDLFQGGSSVVRQVIWMEAVWSDGALIGSGGSRYNEETTQGGQTDAYSCNEENEFTAVKVTSNESKYVED